MLNVGLTGNIAAGKSSVAELFRRWGATIIDADALAREAQAPGSEALAAIVRRFGADVLAPDGGLDRAALRAKVMGDQAALDALNQIVHPAVRRRRDELLRAARERGDVLVVNEIPLLFEALDPAQFDAIVLVDAPAAVRRTRLRVLRGLSNEEADRMIAAQMPAERKRARSDFVIENDGAPADLEVRARQVFLELRRRAAAAALGRPAHTLLLAHVEADDPSALAALAALAARYRDAGLTVRRAVGAAAIAREFEPPAPAPAPAPGPGRPPDGTVATAAAARAARAAWERAQRPGVLAWLSHDPDPAAVRLDLRPWDDDRLLLMEPDATGLVPRADLFPAPNPLP
jgi:dephospho-CoA kinase